MKAHSRAALVAASMMSSLWLASCGGSRSEPIAPTPAAPAAATLPEQKPGSAKGEPPNTETEAAPTAASAPAPSAAVHYPPPPAKPPHERSAQPGDGQWTVFGGATDLAGTGAPAFHKTTLHPHPTSRFIELTVVAIDLTKVSLHFMPGTEDVGTVKAAFTPGLVPADERERVLAVFNGGFQPKHGRWGMRREDTTIVPPRDIGCTIALGTDGGVRVRSFSAVSSDLPALRAVRQTPPCLVEQNVVHPDLVAGRDKIWAGRTPGLVTRRRSAIGLDDTGSVLFYAIGVETTPRLLAEGLRAAGAHDAAQLDINWNWTRFLLFGKDDRGELRVSTPLVEGDYSKTGYVTRPSERDFFYILRR